MLALAVAAALSWTTISQSRFGASIDVIRAQQHANLTYNSSSHPQAALGFLWHFPQDSSS